MKQKALLLIFIFLFLFPDVFAQALPNREFRGVWVATVSNLDWPERGATAESQKAALRSLFDKIKEANLNVVFFQIRSECDAFYKSSKEPWSRYLTGTQGKDPGYDPLAFAIDEAHKRGLELHAWLNPFRVNVSPSTAVSYASQHISNTKQEWILNFPNGKKVLNPGLPEVREYVASVVKDVAENYDIDGIHFDDYFYPYPEGDFKGISTEDAATFAQHGSGFSNIKDWRRNNVNETIKLVKDQLKATKPEVRFGVSPFGIWKSGVPSGISGMDAYNTIYADPINWLENQTVDYLTPQLYWAIGGAQDYRKLLEWWSDKAFNASRHLYAGHAIYKTTYSAEEVPNQIAITRANQQKNALGAVLFRAANITSNANGIFTALKGKTFQFSAAPPAMAWKISKKPAPPVSLAVVKDEITGAITINWKRNPANSHTFKRYIVYNLPMAAGTVAEIPNGAVRALTASETVTIAAQDVPQQYAYWAVTELNPGNVESELSNVVFTGVLRAVAEVEEVTPINIFPNPVSTKFFVDINLKRRSEVEAELVSMDGTSKARIQKKRYPAGTHTLSIDREKLSPGTYVFVLSINRKKASKKVVLL